MKTSKWRKLWIILAVIALFFIILLCLPFVFKGKIVDFTKQQLNKQLIAHIDFDKIQLSFIRRFPNASIQIKNLKIIGIDEFEKDTLLATEKIEAVVNLKSFFSDTGYDISKILLANSQVKAHVLPDGKANWNIVKEKPEAEKDTSKMNFHLKLKDVILQNINLTYLDEQGNMKIQVCNLNHHTSGDLTADSSLLETDTRIDSLSFWMNNVAYLSKANVKLKVDVDADLNNMMFKLSDNSILINALPFSINGWLKVLDDGFDMDLKLLADKVDFKSILSLIPALYYQSFKELKADGKISLDASVKGQMKEDNYPSFNLKLNVDDGWFRYPSLPKAVQNIQIATQIFHPDGNLDKTVVDISKVSFVLDKQPFFVSCRILTPVSDPQIQVVAQGKIEMDKIKDFYPLGDKTKLNGLLDIDASLNGRMSYIENNQYDKFNFQGKLNLERFLMKDVNLYPQEITINNASLLMNPSFVNLSLSGLKIGENNLSAQGKLENIIAYLLKNKTLSGQLNAQSSYLNLNDFITSQPDNESATEKKVLEIPKNINFIVNADLNKVKFDKMIFENIKGKLEIENGELKLQNVALQAFGGNILAKGLYSTLLPENPKLKVDLNIDSVVINKIFTQIGFMEKLVPFLKNTDGKFSTNLSLDANLKNDMSLDLTSLNANGVFSTRAVGIKNSPIFNALANNLNRPEFMQPTLKDIALKFEILNGKIFIKPFDFKISNIKMNLGGSSSLNKEIDFQGIIQLPDQVNIGRFSTVKVNITGTYDKPKIKLDVMNTLSEIVDETKLKVEAEVAKQVDKAKQEALEKAQKQKEKALQEAQQQADKIRLEAQKKSEKILEEARKESDALVAKATNPVAKKVAETTAKKLLDEAQKKVDQINSEAEAEAQKIIQNATKNLQ
ncbi:MAG: hypothetical protein KBG25_03720 [Paludibacteraceae bacterium]|nr:hypothetical protein [Paludibacteraceae bacterium]